MNCIEIGAGIKELRRKKGMTQKQLADILHISDKTVSKWERGCGCPDLSILPELSKALGSDIESILSGNPKNQKTKGASMRNIKYYVCPVCGNVITSFGDAVITCCGVQLKPMKCEKATEEQKLNVETVEDEYYITSNHPMEKDNYISFVAFAAFDRVTMLRQYPEWQLQIRLPKSRRGKLVWYSTSQGLLWQQI